MGTSVVKNSRDDAHPAARPLPSCTPMTANLWQGDIKLFCQLQVKSGVSLWEKKKFVCDKRNFSLWEGNSVTLSLCFFFHVAVQLHKIWYHRISCSTNQFLLWPGVTSRMSWKQLELLKRRVYLHQKIVYAESRIEWSEAAKIPSQSSENIQFPTLCPDY